MSHRHIALYIASMIPDAKESDFKLIKDIYYKGHHRERVIETTECNRHLSDDVTLVSYTRDLSDIFHPRYANGDTQFDYATVAAETEWIIKGKTYKCNVSIEYVVTLEANGITLYSAEDENTFTGPYPDYIYDITNCLCCYDKSKASDLSEFEDYIHDFTMDLKD